MVTDFPATHELPPRVLLYDGVCGLCNKWVQWMLDHDTEGRIAFAALQGDTAAAVKARTPSWPTDLDSLVYVRQTPGGERVLWYSDSVIAALDDLGWPWRAVRIFRIVPGFIRHPAYRFMAARRLRFFGTVDACRLPQENEQARFLP